MRISGVASDATCALAMFDREGPTVTVSRTGEDAERGLWADHARSAGQRKTRSVTTCRYVGGTMSAEMEMPKRLWLKRNCAIMGALRLALDLADFLLWKATGHRGLRMHGDLQVDY